jgi:ribonuclease Z
MKVIPLGTSSGKPTLTRHLSALAVVRESEWLLFDCGEATQFQVMRAGLQPSRLSAVFITHLHGDHINGLPGLLSSMALDRRERGLVAVGPPGLKQLIDTLERLKILFVTYDLVIREIGSDAFGDSGSGVPAGGLVYAYETNDYTVSCLPLDHRIFALGYRLEERPRPGRFDVQRARKLGVPEGPLFGRLQAGHNVTLPDGRTVLPSDVLGAQRAGLKLAYCTDTRDCGTSRELARDVDLLIHEATYTGELSAEATQNGHSTAAQAAGVARDANAKNLLITHFSPRYRDVTQLLDEAIQIFPSTSAAEELVAVAVSPR